MEEVFGWSKTVGGWKLRYVGIPRNQMWAELTVTAFGADGQLGPCTRVTSNANRVSKGPQKALWRTPMPQFQYASAP